MAGKFNSLRDPARRPSRESTGRDGYRLRFEALEQRWMPSTTPLIGQVDDFQDGTTQNWTNGPVANPVNVLGGPGGASDRFLQVSSGTFGGGPRLVVFNDTQWIGNYVAAGMTAIEMDLKNFTASAEAIRIALRTSSGGSTTPGYSSTTAFALPPDNAWHHAVFSLDSGSLTGINSPPPLSTFLTAVGDCRILQAAAGPALIGDFGNFQVGVDNITADGQPQLSFQQSTVSLPEGNAGTTPFVFTVTLSSVSGATVTYATADGTATVADADYMATSGTLTFAPGVTTQAITVLVNGDTLFEADETFTVNLSNPTNAALYGASATGTIQNDDPVPSLSFVPQTVSHLEGNSGTTPFVFTVSLSAASGQTATVNFTTADGTATIADNDYIGTSGTLSFAPGETAQLITVLVNGDTAIEQNENFVVNLASAVNANITTPQATGTIVTDDATIVGRFLFYHNSARYDTTGNPQTPLPFSDDNAIATDKSAYIPNGTASTFANLSSYDKGINGIMVDLMGAGAPMSITLANILNDFTFKMGNNNSPGLWTAAPLPIAVAVRSGAGSSGSDRVELIWADGSIQQQWLEVAVKATADTGLVANDVFFFGNEIGSTGASNTATVAKVSSLDVTGAQTHGASLKANIPLTNIYDFNKDGQVSSFDVTDAQTHGTSNKTGLQLISIAAGGPFAPVVAAATAGGDSGTSSALTSTATNPKTPAIPPWIVNRLTHLDLNRIDLNSGPIVKYLEHLARDNTAKSRAILVKADPVAEPLNLDDTLLDSLLVKLGLE
ncbi:MAG: hypothetical protein HY288_03895 [Planctomycetia bacterium]|nr:hypothetical protein [Planctomycetia bacterium]